MKIKALAIFILAAACAGFAGGAAAQDCSVDIDSTDAMKFDTDVVVVDSACDEFTVNLTHSGKLGRDVMGHNWVLTTASDVQPVALDGMKVGLENNYIKPDDERVIAFTKVIGGGEKTSVTFAVDGFQADTVYNFFCSFPGHWSVMRGTLSLK